MKKLNQHGIALAIIIAIIIAVILIGGAVWYFTKPEEKTNINSAVNIAPVTNKNINLNVNATANTNVNTNINANANTNAAPLDISTWQTFRNSKYDYTIKFPQNWYYIPDAMTGPPPPASAFFSNEKKDASQNYASFDVLVNSIKGETLDSYAEINLLVQDNYQKKDITVSGQPAVRLERRTLQSDTGGSIYVAKGNYMYRITWGATDSALFATHEVTLEAMIDSFAFVSPLTADFTQTGNLSMPADSTKWYLLWETPGNPANNVELVFNYQYMQSRCIIGTSEGGCVDALTTGLLKAGDAMSLEGLKLDNSRVAVIKMTKQ